MVSARKSAPRIALAVAGGGPLGAIYEIGAMCALEDSLVGLNFNALHHYVGVSAGGFIVAALANGMRPRELCAAFIDGTAPDGETFDPAWLMQPAYLEYLQRSARLPWLVGSALWGIALGRKSVWAAIEHLAPALPTGLFSNAAIDTQLARLFSRKGRTNDFRKLPCQLTLVATHLDTAEAAPFGRPGWDHVPISKAVQASAALPGLFPPVEIDGQWYVDGALKKTMHASVALDEGVDLLLCLNPLVPFDAAAGTAKAAASTAAANAVFHPGTPSKQRARHNTGIIDGGLPAVLSQTFRSMIHSRMELGMKHYERAYPHTDIVLIEPDHQDAALHHASTFGYAQRREIAEHAYQQTRQLLRTQRAAIGRKLARHGVALDEASLDNTQRRLLLPAKLPELGSGLAHTLHAVLDQLSTAISTPPRGRKQRSAGSTSS
jgi:predicted acylesterase/phospholipase RssA